MVVRVVQLVPQRASAEQNQLQEMAALRDAGYEVTVVSAPSPGIRGILWLATIGVRKAIHEKPDIVSARDLDALGAGVKVKRRTGAKLVYDMHEVYPYMVEDDVPAEVVRYVTWRERHLLMDVDLALASDSERAQWLADQGYVYRPRQIVLNCRDPVVPYRPPPNDRSLCYTGTLHPSRFIREMVEAMDQIDGTLTIAGPRTPGSLYDWLNKNYGCGPEGFYDVVKVGFLGTLSPQRALEVLQGSDVSIQMANPASRINRLGPYNRLFDAMAVGRPSIGSAETENGNIISNLRLGITSMYNPESYIRAVKALFELSKADRAQLGMNAYAACTKTFNWAAQAKLLVEAYERLK